MHISVDLCTGFSILHAHLIVQKCPGTVGGSMDTSLFLSVIYFTLSLPYTHPYTKHAHTHTDPLKKVIITESTREVLFLQTDWCQQLRMATTAPPPLPQRRSRRLRGQKTLSPSCRQVEEEWSGASPTPPSGGSPLSGAPPSLKLLLLHHSFTFLSLCVSLSFLTLHLYYIHYMVMLCSVHYVPR